MILAVVAFVVGLIALVKGADEFVVAAERIAVRRGWSPAAIGAVVVGFGTSLPELVTSVDAAWAGAPDIAIGNAAGSNVANLLLILGIAAIVAPLRGVKNDAARDAAIATVAGVLLLALARDGTLGVIDAFVLLAVIMGAVAWQVRAAPVAGHVPAPEPARRLIVTSVLALIVVVAGARGVVWGATRLAEAAGVPRIVIGSILVAIGTSLPELATAIASARRGQVALLLGNLLGSNAFNALAVVGFAAIAGRMRGAALAVSAPALWVVIAAAGATMAIGAWVWIAPRIGRVAGVLFVLVYVAMVPFLIAGS